MHRRILGNNFCQVCGDKAHISNYGALSCASCKSFFRRHGFHPENIPKCSSYKNCEITMQSRKLCSACRFAKCLQIGMHPYRIRKEEFIAKTFSSKNFRKQRTILSRTILSRGIRTPLNLLSGDTSSLSLLNWTLLSNIIHAFDSFCPLMKIRNIIEFLASFSTDYQYTLKQAQNIVSLICRSLRLSVSSTPDFRIMTTDEQCSLIHRNIRGVWTFYSMVVCHQCNLFDSETNKRIMVPLYGRENVERVKIFSSQLDSDLTFVKLTLMTLSFSSNCFAIKYDQINKKDSLSMGTFRLFGSQNVYVETMWQYMLYKYGYFESAKRFSTLIKIMLDEIKLGSTIYDSNIIHRDLANNIIQESERSLTISSNENIPLWGKNYIIT